LLTVGGRNPEHAIGRFARRPKLGKSADHWVGRFLDFEIGTVLEVEPELQGIIGGGDIHAHGDFVLLARGVFERASPMERKAGGGVGDFGELLILAQDRGDVLVRQKQDQAEVFG
jgi:hypothetical protein